MKKYLSKIFTFIALCLFLGGAQESAVAALFPRTNLQTYENNLDILSDKTGSLDDLVGELQGYRTYSASGSVVGSSISVPGILPTDTIVGVTIISSGCVGFNGSTVIGRAGEAGLALQSRICGYPGINLNISIVQKESITSVSSKTLTINTTGFAFEIQLASNTNSPNDVSLSSGLAIANAIRSHPWLGKMIQVSTNVSNTFSTMSFVNANPRTDLVNQYFWRQGDVTTWVQLSTSNVFPRQQYTLRDPSSYITIPSSGVVQIQTTSPITKDDMIYIHTNGYRE